MVPCGLGCLDFLDDISYELFSCTVKALKGMIVSAHTMASNFRFLVYALITWVLRALTSADIQLVKLDALEEVKLCTAVAFVMKIIHMLP